MAEVIVRSATGEQRVPLSSATLSIGREKFNDIVIADPKASRKHAQVEKIGEQWVLTDLGSSNGTFLRGERISQVVIHEGDTFTIGAIGMSFVGVESRPSDDLAPTTMATAEEVQARMNRMQQQAQVPTRPTPPVAPPPPPSPQGMETVDLKALSGGAPKPPAPAPFADQQTMDLAALRSPPKGAAPGPTPDMEDMGTVAIMADQQKQAVSLAPPPVITGGPSNPFGAANSALRPPGAPAAPPPAFAPPPPSLGGKPPMGGRPPAGGADKLLSGPGDLDIGRYISTGWSLVKENLGTFAIYTLICMIAGAVPVVGGFLSMILYAGMALGVRKAMSGAKVELGDCFKVFDKFMPLFLAALVGGILTALGVVCLIIPGIYLAIAYGGMIPQLLILDRDMEFWPALETSRKFVTQKWFGFFLFAIVLALLVLAGFLALVVGAFVAIPVAIAAMTVMYEEQIGFKNL